MNRSIQILAVSAALACGVSAASAANTRQASGTAAGFNWLAQSYIVGANSTATLAAGGSSRYFANDPAYSGVVSLIMDYGAAGAFICTGSLLPDRQSILTAAHCVTDGPTLANPISTTAYFYNGGNPDSVTFIDPTATAVGVSQYFVQPLYTGEVIDENDVAVLRLSSAAPVWAQSYGLYTAGLDGVQYNIAGYGARSLIGGATGADLGVGRLRQGDNRYEWQLGDADFGGFWDGFFGSAASGGVVLSDFDNGLAANDTGCLIADAFALVGPKYCNLGLGLDEVSSAGGDSGGPQFVNGMIASVTSFGLSFGPEFGDQVDGLQSSFGEFNGFVPVSMHEAFITASMVPETSTYLMMALGLLGIAGVTRRRQR